MGKSVKYGGSGLEGALGLQSRGPPAKTLEQLCGCHSLSKRGRQAVLLQARVDEVRGKSRLRVTFVQTSPKAFIKSCWCRIWKQALKQHASPCPSPWSTTAAVWTNPCTMTSGQRRQTLSINNITCSDHSARLSLDPLWYH